MKSELLETGWGKKYEGGGENDGSHNGKINLFILIKIIYEEFIFARNIIMGTQLSTPHLNPISMQNLISHDSVKILFEKIL
jgi:hypothetical protein